MSAAIEQAKAFAELGAQRVFHRIVLCTAIDHPSGVATFNVNGGVQSARIFGFPPAVGVEALLLYIGGVPFCMGPAYRAPWGVVAEAPSAGKVAVDGDDGNRYLVPYADSLDLLVADRVAIEWGSGVAVAEPASEAADGDTAGPGGGSGEVRTWTFYPVDSGSFGSSWFTDRVYCSDSNVGCYFYAGIADTIPDSAVVLDNWVHLDATQVSGGAPTIGLHNLDGKAGAPSVSSAVTIGSGSGDFHLPTSFGDSLKTGATKGFGTDHGGYHIFSPANVNNSGAYTVVAQL